MKSCPHCNKQVNTDKGFLSPQPHDIFLCNHCSKLIELTENRTLVKADDSIKRIERLLKTPQVISNVFNL